MADDDVVEEVYTLFDEFAYEEWEFTDETPPPKVSNKYIDDELEMTEEQYANYRAQIDESDGFYVERIPGVSEIGQIEPLALEIKSIMDDCVSYSKTAIDEFNKRGFKDTEGQLEFEKVLMATGVAVSGLMFYLTFDAKNLAKGGRIITYQAVVLYSYDGLKVLSFRKKPSGSEKEWFWAGHYCGCKSSDDV